MASSSRASSLLGFAAVATVTPAYNRTACPASATCCKQAWSPSEGAWGCCPTPNAVCCGDYTCCPEGTKCVNAGSGWQVVSTCVPDEDHADTDAEKAPRGPLLGFQVCKQGPPTPLAANSRNVLIIGDSVSIGYTPPVATLMAPAASVQHSPWGGDGGAEETAYGDLCLDFLLRSPNGTYLPPGLDVLYFNWGLHNLGNTSIPGQAGPSTEYLPHLENIVGKLKTACKKPSCKLIFGITSPMLCNQAEDDVVVELNAKASALMAENDIPTVDLHKAIVGKCGPVPEASCFGHAGCFCPHCPQGGGYDWLANSTIVPAITKLL